MSTQNPDFTIESKRLIARATRRVLGTPAANGNTARPAFPRGGGGGDLPQPEFYGQVYGGVANLTGGFMLLPLVNIVP